MRYQGAKEAVARLVALTGPLTPILGGVARGSPLTAGFNPHYSVRRDKVPFLSGANPARQLSLQPVAVGADDGGNDIG